MTDNRRLPVLFVSDLVVLPGMVVPVELDEPAQAAVDAARATGEGELLLAPRLDDRYAAFGVVATIEQLGRLPGGGPAAVLRAGGRARIGSGVTGPGAALWVEAELVSDAPVTEAVRELGHRVQGARRGDPAAARRLAGHRLRAADQRPVRRWRTRPATRRTSTDEQKRGCSRRPTSTRG